MTARSAKSSLLALSSSVSGGKGSGAGASVGGALSSRLSNLGLMGGRPRLSYWEGGLEILPGGLVDKGVLCLNVSV